MTRLRWTEPAHDDFLGIVVWVKARNPQAAARVGRRILDAVEDLAAHPYLGKPGRAADTRELIVTRFPYLVIYTVEADTDDQPQTVVILRVLHGAMLWPRDEDASN
jgi:plasmid stabilization system protein ParE